MEIDERLVEEIKRRDFLYNKKLRTYRDVNKRERGWAEIASALESDVDFCKARWRTLRDRFCKEAGKNPSGSGAEFPTKWPFFQHLLFLKEHVTPRKTVHNFPQLEDASSNQPSATEGDISVEIEEPQPAVKKQQKRPRDVDNIDEQFSSLASAMTVFMKNTCKPKEEDENEPFLKIISRQLNKFPPHIREAKTLELLVWLHNETMMYEAESSQEQAHY